MEEQKAVYTAPKLVVHGDLAEITQTNAKTNDQDVLGVPPPVTGSNY